MAGQVWSGGWSSGTLGGYLANEKLSTEIRHAAQPICKFRQFVSIKEALGKGKGDTVIYDKMSNLSTAGGTLVETSTMPEAQATLLKGTMNVTEYGNSVPYTGKLEALAGFDVENLTTRALRDDEVKVLDSAAGAQFQAGHAKYVCITTTSGTLTTNSTAGATATSNLNGYHVRKIVNQMKKWNVPKVDGENYVCIASVEAISGLFDDTAAGGWQDTVKYRDAVKLFNGEVGKYHGCRFVEETNLLSNILGGSYGEAVFFGADAVMESIAIPEEIRMKVPGDYGRSKGVCWYGIMGFQCIWNYSDDTEEHIIHVTSL